MAIAHHKRATRLFGSLDCVDRGIRCDLVRPKARFLQCLKTTRQKLKRPLRSDIHFLFYATPCFGGTFDIEDFIFLAG